MLGCFILLYEYADARRGLIWVFVAVCVEDSARIVLSENIILCVCVCVCMTYLGYL